MDIVNHSYFVQDNCDIKSSYRHMPFDLLLHYFFIRGEIIQSGKEISLKTLLIVMDSAAFH